MRKSTHNLLLWIAVGAVVPVAAAIILLRAQPREAEPRIEEILAAYQDDATYTGITVRYPLDNTLFPPEIVPPTFRWEDRNSGCDRWLIRITFQDDKDDLTFLTRRSRWTPKARVWEAAKTRSLEKKAIVAILGVKRSNPREILSGGGISIQTSQDEVGSPLFYREVNLPFIEAVKDPSRIRWRFGTISSVQPPPIVLEGLPVCGNCHSFSADGATLAMDVDYANSKGSYVITSVAQQMRLATSDIITWNDYRKEDGELTFGLLSQVSPDGKVVISTVKDKSVFVPKPGLAFSQLFFPIKGILCVYDRQTRTFTALPGADDPQFVQSNPSWSPDGKHIVFARALAYSLKHTSGEGRVLLTPEECREFLEDGKPFPFDLYKIPYNDGKGGTPEPLEGASNNGMSNFFARYSPDGKWIVFCKAKSYMLLQPDSELYIIPAEGGEARRLQCNTSKMNSWHSWSPNGKWLVFSSKANSPYTQLFLTHIDGEGRSTPAVLLSNLTAPDRAANIPEFVDIRSSAIRKIDEEFLDDYSHERAADAFYRYGEADHAIPEYRKALELNPNNSRAHQKLGFLLYNVKQKYEEGIAHLALAIRIDRGNARAYHDLGMAFLHQKDYAKAEENLNAALRLMPNGLDQQYNAVNLRYKLGVALAYQGKFTECTAYFTEAIRLDPRNPDIHYGIAKALAAQGDTDQAFRHYTEAIRINPDVDTSPDFHDVLAMNYARSGQFQNAIACAEKALRLAIAAGQREYARDIEQRIELFRQGATPPPTSLPRP